jgi:hypothetical protein
VEMAIRIVFPDTSSYPGPPPRARIKLTISPGSACLRSAFLEKIGSPSALTSKTPPDDGISRTSVSGQASFSSAASLAARGS